MLVSLTNSLSRRQQEVKESNCDGFVRTVVMIEVRAEGAVMMGTCADDIIYWRRDSDKICSFTDVCLRVESKTLKQPS